MTTKTKTKKTMKRAEKTQTDTVLELMKKYPNITPKEIETQTGIKRATVYAIQSRARNKAKREHTAVADNGQMNQVADTATDTLAQPEHASKTELFDYVTKQYLQRIEESNDIDTAKKYNELLIDIMQAL